MDSFTVESAAAWPVFGDTPTHKITIIHGSNTCVFWYVKGAPELRDFDKTKDMALVKLMYAKGCALDPDEFESFTIGRNDYHLKRIRRQDFVIKVLRGRQ